MSRNKWSALYDTIFFNPRLASTRNRIVAAVITRKSSGSDDRFPVASRSLIASTTYVRGLIMAIGLIHDGIIASG